ncbi:unnamed protein product [Phytomonas sp. Hart1]|nr:unnamed protein product [Phytomonas sp. Hart1]|eukprot:CCW70437.1 unnamed protein product [Phytomonas sp. isolate Hart1]
MGVRTLQREVCERVVLARHGVLGVRLMKLLLRDHLLEDRTLAEAAIAPQPRTRETLHAMLRDGFVFIQEAPRGAPLSEQRLVKNSIFLWGSHLEQAILPNVREQIASVLHHALVNLHEVAGEATKPHAFGNHNEGTSSMLGGHSMLHVLKGEPPTAGPPTSYSNNDSTSNREGKVSEETVRQVVQAQRSIIGMESCAASLMRLLLLADYY